MTVRVESFSRFGSGFEPLEDRIVPLAPPLDYSSTFFDNVAASWQSSMQDAAKNLEVQKQQRMKLYADRVGLYQQSFVAQVGDLQKQETATGETFQKVVVALAVAANKTEQQLLEQYQAIQEQRGKIATDIQLEAAKKLEQAAATNAPPQVSGQIIHETSQTISNFTQAQDRQMADIMRQVGALKQQYAQQVQQQVAATMATYSHLKTAQQRVMTAFQQNAIGEYVAAQKDLQAFQAEFQRTLVAAQQAIAQALQQQRAQAEAAAAQVAAAQAQALAVQTQSPSIYQPTDFDYSDFYGTSVGSTGYNGPVTSTSTSSPYTSTSTGYNGPVTSAGTGGGFSGSGQSLRIDDSYALR